VLTKIRLKSVLSKLQALSQFLVSLDIFRLDLVHVL
jgi:hypothetical protein